MCSQIPGSRGHQELYTLKILWGQISLFKHPEALMRAQTGLDLASWGGMHWQPGLRPHVTLPHLRAFLPSSLARSDSACYPGGWMLIEVSERGQWRRRTKARKKCLYFQMLLLLQEAIMGSERPITMKAVVYWNNFFTNIYTEKQASFSMVDNVI